MSAKGQKHVLRFAATSVDFINYSDSRQNSAEVAKRIRARATAFSHHGGDRKPKARRKKPKVLPRSAVTQLRRKVVLNDSTPGVGLSPGAVDEEQHDLLLRMCNTLTVTVSGNPVEPFDAYPVPTRSWFAWVLAFYRTIHLPAGMAVVRRTPEEGQAYIDWHLRESMSESSMFYMQLLNACTPLVTQGRISHGIVLWLRGQIIASLNEAIADPKRRLCRPVLLTVASVALHEILYGDYTAATQVHWPAFVKMLDMRGGLGSLEMPRIGIALIDFTADVLTASLSGQHAAELLERWAPEDMRKRHPGYDAPSEE